MSTPIFFVSLITRDNRPLYIQPFSPYETEEPSTEEPKTLTEEHKANELLKYNFLSHMALDVFLSPFYDPKNALLFIQDGVSVYGFETNTGLKIIVGTSTRTNISAELAEKIHRAYLRLICNPFQQLDEDSLVSSKSFEGSIEKIVREWNDVTDE